MHCLVLIKDIFQYHQIPFIQIIIIISSIINLIILFLNHYYYHY